MEPCGTHKESLWLDVYGELAEAERVAWEKHLKTCGACRVEREALARLLQKTKDALLVPLPSPSPLEQAQATWQRKHEKTTERAWWWTRLLPPVPARSVPVFATVLLLVAAFSWFALIRGESSRRAAPTENLAVGTALTAEEFAVIKDLRILKEMETVERLVQVLDKPQTLEEKPEEETTHERKNHTENT